MRRLISAVVVILCNLALPPAFGQAGSQFDHVTTR